MKTALLIEDSDDTAQILMYILARDGFIVSRAKSFASAKEELDKVKYGVIISDLNIGNDNGFEIAIYIRRKDNKNKDTNIIAVTGSGLSEDKRDAKRIGFSSYLVKPIEPEEFVRVVNLFCKTEMDV